jgi:hypothetical protein
MGQNYYLAFNNLITNNIITWHFTILNKYYYLRPLINPPYSPLLQSIPTFKGII